MEVIEASLLGEQDQLLGTVAVGVDIHHQFQASVFQLTQTQLGHLDTPEFLWSDTDAGLLRYAGGFVM